jgi:hypothetical protein
MATTTAKLFPMLVNGRAVEGLQTLPVLNPATEERRDWKTPSAPPARPFPAGATRPMPTGRPHCAALAQHWRSMPTNSPPC